MNLYVGNLPFKIKEEELRQVFEQFGEVSSARIMTDRQTGRSRGFGFVEMPNSDEAQAAINGVKEIQGREAIVNEARPREDRR